MPYGRRFFTRRPRKYIRRARKVAKKAPRTSRSFVKKVQKIISKNVETKEAFHDTGDSLVYFNSYINSSGDMQRILPNISRGANENERIGAVIRAQTLTIKGYIQLDPDVVVNNADNKRLGVRLMVVSMKKYKTLDAVQASAGTALIEKGGSASNFSGYISHLYAPINREEYITHFDRVLYLSQSYTAQQVGSSTPTVQWSVDLSKGLRFFKISIPMRGKKLIYSQDTGSDVQPVNFAPVLCVGYAHLNGATPDLVTTKCGICYDVKMTYEDA